MLIGKAILQDITTIKKRLSDKKIVYLICILLLDLIGFIGLYMSHGNALDSLIFNQGNDHFMDFFNHIEYTHNLSYSYRVTIHANHPPLYMVYSHVLHNILPEGSVVNFQSGQTGNYALLLYALYCCITSVLLYSAIRVTMKGVRFSNLIAGSFFFSVVFVYTVERGNPVVLVLFMLLYALHLMEEPSKLKKELALILFSICANIKIYTLLLAVIYLKERRFREFFRYILYSELLFVIPLCIYFQPSEILVMLNNANSIMNPDNIAIFGIKGFYNLIISFITHNVELQETLQSFSNIPVLLALIVNLFLFFRSTDKWEGLAYLVFIMIMTPTWSGTYTMIYLLIPMLYYYKESDQTEGRFVQVAPAVLFACIFSALYLPISVNGFALSLLVSGFAIYTLMFFLWRRLSTVSFPQRRLDK